MIQLKGVVANMLSVFNTLTRQKNRLSLSPRSRENVCLWADRL